MKKFRIIICVALCLSLFATVASAADATDTQSAVVIDTKAKSSILMCTDTGDIIFEDNSHEKLNPASVTKIMSLLLFAEAVDSGRMALTDEVNTSRAASQKGGSQIWLKENEKMVVDDMLKAIAVASANDACAAMAEHLSGSEEAFVQLMNQRAKELEMNDTNFENCSGLDDTATNHVSSAYDIAIMSKELIKHTFILDYTTIWMDTLRDGATELTNTNKLVRFYEGATGLKTGTTDKAGSCLSATATRDGLSLVAVVMGCATSNDRFDGAKALLNYGFAGYELFTPKITMDMLTDVIVLNGVEKKIKPSIEKIMPILITKGTAEQIIQKINLPEKISAPVEDGQVLGEVVLEHGEKLIGDVKLISTQDINQSTFSVVFLQMLRLLVS